jgi:hypothetical protein
MTGFSFLFNPHVQDARLILRIAAISYNQITDSQRNIFFCASIPKHKFFIGSIEI